MFRKRDLGLTFVPGREPQKENNRLVFRRALELDRQCAARRWKEVNKRISQTLDRTNAQIVVLTTYPNDASAALYRSFKENPLGRYSVATIQEKKFSDGEFELWVTGEAQEAESVYLMASVTNTEDFSRIRRVADHFKNDLNARCVTLIASFLGTARQDKNVDRYGNYLPIAINIRAELGGLAASVDRMIVLESHSGATQAFAAKEFGIPLISLSPWHFMVKRAMQKALLVGETGGEKIRLTPENTIVIRPDNGRNLAAKKIQAHLGVGSISFEKVRISGEEVDVYELTPVEQELIKNKFGLIYDDEVSTMGTMNRIARALERYESLGMVVFVVHGKFTPGWEERIQHPLIRAVFCTDSREPVGNITLSHKIHIINLMPLLRRVPEADIKGVDFYTNSFWEKMIL